jgi:hypothetical protein
MADGMEVALDARLKKKLEDLGRAVSEAIADSPDAGRHLAELRREGFSVHLLLESAEERNARTEVGRATTGGARVQRRLTGERPVAVERRLEPATERSPAPAAPSFLIDGRDLAFLRSVGIDPTRSPRRKKSG